MKKLFTIALVLVLSLMVVGSAFARPTALTTRHWANWRQFSSTGWGGWSCPTGTTVVGGGYISRPPGATVAISQAAKPGVGTYPDYPHYDYTPPEEGWVVQNDKTPSMIRIYVDCYEYVLCEETTRWPNVVVFGEWSEFEWDAARELFVSTRTKTITKTLADLYDQKHICRQWDVVKIEERTRGPDEVIVGVSLRCSTPDSEGTIWQLIAGITVEPTGGAILTLDGTNYTASQSFHTNFGNHVWSAVANESFTLIGDTSGSLKITESDCDVPFVHLPTGPSGQPINLPLVILIGLIGVSALSAGVVVVKRSRL